MDDAPRALITGITGQDGSYLAELLLSKGYLVHGVVRRASVFNTERIDGIYQDPHEAGRRLHLHYGDMTDGSSLARLVQDIDPHEVYHLAAQSHVKVSFEVPEYTADVDALGTLRLLEGVRRAGGRARVFHAASSEMFGGLGPVPQDEATPFHPRSPYAAAKVYAYWMVVNYREAYGLHASNGICFNHESPRRGKTFVTRKITRAAARISVGLQDTVWLGNLDAQRDWGWAPEYVYGMWSMLQQDAPDDLVFATGEVHSVRELAERAFATVGLPLRWEGAGADEQGLSVDDGRPLVQVDPAYYRPAEAPRLCGDASRARARIGWEARVRFPDIVDRMVAHDLAEAQREGSP